MLLMQSDRETLLEALQSVIGIVERRHTLPILSNVLLIGSENKLVFTATDLEIEISAQIDEIKLEQNFSLTTSAKKMYDILRALPEKTAVSVDNQDNKLLIKGARSRFNLQTLPAEDFPKFQSGETPDAVIELSQKALKDLLHHVQFSMAQQDIRYYLNGMLLVLRESEIIAVATDGHRLSFCSGVLPQSAQSMEIIIPRKTIVELMRLLSDSDELIKIEISKNQITFRLKNIALHSKVVDGKFPDYTKVIPAAYKNSFVIDRLILLQALQRAAILSNEKFRGVRLVLTQDSVKAISRNSEQEEAQEELEVSYSGDPIDIGFNVSYLLDVLTNLGDQKIECALGDSNSSAVFTIPENQGFKYVVMPMRI